MPVCVSIWVYAMHGCVLTFFLSLSLKHFIPNDHYVYFFPNCFIVAFNIIFLNYSWSWLLSLNFKCFFVLIVNLIWLILYYTHSQHNMITLPIYLLFIHHVSNTWIIPNNNNIYSHCCCFCCLYIDKLYTTIIVVCSLCSPQWFLLFVSCLAAWFLIDDEDKLDSNQFWY